VLETKAHGGRVTVKDGRLLVNGHDPEKDFIAQALHNTYWLREKTRPVLVLRERICRTDGSGQRGGDRQQEVSLEYPAKVKCEGA
jgi:hypothetical protein